MLPLWHILWGAVFTALIWFFSPSIGLIYLALLFLSSFLIDLDRYIASAVSTGRLSPVHSFRHHKKVIESVNKDKQKGIRKKAYFHFFHTIEFHILIAFLAFFWMPFFYIFIGMVFHSLLDLVSLLHKGHFHTREYFFFRSVRQLLSK